MYAMNAQSKISDYDSNLVNCTMALDEAIQARDDMEVEKHKLQRRIDEMSLKNAGENSIPEKYIKQFHEKGVTRPVPIIQTDLIKKNSMIPYESATTAPWHISATELFSDGCSWNMMSGAVVISGGK